MASPVQTPEKDFVFNIPLLPAEHARGIDLIATYGSPKTLVQAVTVTQALLDKHGFQGNVAKLYLVPCYDFTMAPVLNLGDAVIVDTSIQSFTEEDLYVVQRGAGVYIRHIEALPDNVLRLKSEDPTDIDVLTTHELANVLGKVVLSLRLSAA